MDACLVSVRYRSLRWADHSSRGVRMSVLCHSDCVMSQWVCYVSVSVLRLSECDMESSKVRKPRPTTAVER